MFHNSSQRKYWTFKREDDVEQMRCRANQKFRNRILESGKVSQYIKDNNNNNNNNNNGPLCDSSPHLLPPLSLSLPLSLCVCVCVCVCVSQPGVSESMFLERHEEDVLFRHYEKRLLDLCNAFKPAMPKSVVVCMMKCFPFICVRATHDLQIPDPCVSHLRRVRPSCTSEDSTWTTPSWSTTLGLSCMYHELNHSDFASHCVNAWSSVIWSRYVMFLLHKINKIAENNLYCSVCTSYFKLSFLFLKADVCIPVLQSGWVQRVQHPVCGQPSAGDPGGTGKGSGADPGVWAAADPATQLSPGGPQPLQTHGGPAHRPQGRWSNATLVLMNSHVATPAHSVVQIICPVTENCCLFINVVPLRQDTPCWRTQSHWGRALMTFWPRSPWQTRGCCSRPLRSLWQLFWTAPQEPASTWRGGSLGALRFKIRNVVKFEFKKKKVDFAVIQW